MFAMNLVLCGVQALVMFLLMLCFVRAVSQRHYDGMWIAVWLYVFSAFMWWLMIDARRDQ
jgi:hypothetical protein